jgi:ABC-2 type transport system ATP-binding protein
MEEKATLMARMGRKTLVLDLAEPLHAIPKSLAKYALEIKKDGLVLQYTYDTKKGSGGFTDLLADVAAAKIRYNDLHTEQSSLEDIFLGLLKS